MRKIYVLAIIMAIIAGISVYYFASSLNDEQDIDEVEYVEVVVASVDIEPNTLITDEMVVITQVRSNTVHSLAITEINKVVGFITKSKIYAGEQIFTTKIGELGNSEDGLAYSIEPGKRAISVAVDNVTGISGYIRKGDYVDVVASIMAIDEVIEDDGKSQDEPISVMLVENLLVLETGVDKTVGSAESEEIYEVVTLSGTPDQIIKINFAASNGTLSLVLRPMLDGGEVGDIYYRKKGTDYERATLEQAKELE